MEVTWEADTPDFRKRRRVPRACLDCQKRKKRCRHTFDHFTVDTSLEDTRGKARGGSAAVDSTVPAPDPLETVRFIGDLNPESILTDLSNKPEGVTRSSRIGVWIEATNREEYPPSVAGDKDIKYKDTASPQRGKDRPLVSNKYQQLYLQEIGAFRELPQQTTDALISTYFACFDQILPLFDDGKFLAKLREGSASTFLVQAICLAACKSEDATHYLRLSDDGPVLPPMAFARALYTGLDAAMKADMEPDRVTRIQILALLSLHNDGPGGLERASMHLAQALHHAHTIGIHIQAHGRHARDHPRLLYWSLWSLDKLNACIGGRPIMIADRDMDIPRPILDGDKTFQTFAVWLSLSDLLAEVIAFYRPTAKHDITGWEDGFPTFEEIAGAKSLEPSHRSRSSPIPICHLTPTEQQLDILELFYNAIAILACRAGNPSTASYKRRVSAAARIQEITNAETESPIPGLPLLPYAVSLSLTVAYRVSRNSRPGSERNGAQADLTSRCEILERLSRRWYQAEAMANVGRKALRSLERPLAGGTGEISATLDDAVAPCKFLPSGKQNEGFDLEPNALDVLSSVAEAQSKSGTRHPASFDLKYGHFNETAMASGHSNEVVKSPSFGVPHGDFQYLDALFIDFADVAMPTFFQDPLFGDGDYFDIPDL